MKLHLTYRAIPSVLVLTLLQLSTPAIAQLVPDTTLPVNSSLSTNGNVLTIEGGTSAGGNLFHSFQDFSIPTGTEAFFNNALSVENILTRVTGKNLSHIDGLIRANGTANLFLLNPNGIAFGPNARLDIGGSFFGTTADSIHFADGVEFNAQNPQATPLLSINVPVGLQFGQNPGGITVRGTGHRHASQIFTPSDRSLNPTGLQVPAGKTLALIGGTIDFAGGIAAVEGGGHLEVGSVSSGQVSLIPTQGGWVGDYSQVEEFRDIHLAQQSLLDASGSNGSLQMHGRNIGLTEGSIALLQNLGAQPSGGMSIHATESLTLAGSRTDGNSGSRIVSENLGTSPIGDITISSTALSILEGGYIGAETYSKAPGSNITVNVSGAIDIDGFAPNNPSYGSAIGTLTFNSGSAGNVTVSSSSLTVLNSARVFSGSFASGRTGTLRVNAAESIDIAGNNPITLGPSGIISATISSENANHVLVNTSRLLVRDGGWLGSNTLAAGSAGSVTINASESVEIRGKAAGSTLAPSRIASTAERLDEAAQGFYRLPPLPSGEAGSLTVNTPSLRITDGAFLTVKNDGVARAGDLQVNAHSIVLDNQGNITASTASGNGGNIRLNLQQGLQMRHGSLVSATAAGTGDGGNLSVDAPVLVGLENSDLVANAVRGKGGNIQIQTQGIFGLENRTQLTPQSDITASSQFGVDGVVTITNPDVEPGSSLISLSQETLDPSEQVVAGCQWTGESEFVATGRGGVPVNPNRPVSSHRSWSDVRDLAAFRGQRVEAASSDVQMPERLVEATGWVVTEDGMVELVAATDPAQTGNFRAAPCNPRSQN